MSTFCALVDSPSPHLDTSHSPLKSRHTKNNSAVSKDGAIAVSCSMAGQRKVWRRLLGTTRSTTTTSPGKCLPKHPRHPSPLSQTTGTKFPKRYESFCTAMTRGVRLRPACLASHSAHASRVVPKWPQLRSQRRFWPGNCINL